MSFNNYKDSLKLDIHISKFSLTMRKDDFFISYLEIINLSTFYFFFILEMICSWHYKDLYIFHTKTSYFCLGFIWLRDRKNFVFPHMSLIGGEKVEGLKKICLVEKKNKMIENNICINLLSYFYYTVYTRVRTHTHNFFFLSNIYN